MKKLILGFFAALCLSFSVSAQTLTDRVASANQNIPTQATTNLQLINDLSTTLLSTQASLTMTQQQLTVANGNTAAANAQVTTLSAQIVTLQGSITTLTSQLAAANSQILADANSINTLNNQIASLKSQIANFTCPAPIVCPLPPAPPVVTPPPPSTDTSAVLTWDAVVGATGYRVYFGTKSGVYNQAFGQGLSTTLTTFTVTNLAPGFTYFFVVTAQNALAESGFSNEVFKVIGTITPPPPPASTESPTGTKVFAIGTDKIVDSTGAVWTLGPKDPAVEGGFEPVVLSNGVLKGTALFLCYSNHQLVAFSKGSSANGIWWVYNGSFFEMFSPAVPVGCA